jgi:hypothetical protein
MTKTELAYVLSVIWDTFQKQEAGKGLSSEDFTTALKEKLNSLPSSAQANIIESVKLAGVALTPDANKAVDIPQMSGANASSNGAIGLVPAPQKANREQFLRGDGSWATPEDTTYDVVSTLAAGLMSPAMLSKLNGIAEGATANTGTITGINMNGSSKGTSGVVDLGTVLTEHQSISHLAPKASPEFTGTPKAPTANAGTNTTQIATTEFVGTAITNALSEITGISFEFVQTLPATGKAGTFYFVPDASGSGTNNFIEYVWNSNANKFEEIGRPSVDLSGYMKSADYPLITEAEIDEIVASL